MQFTFKKTIGDTEFTFIEEAQNMKEFFKKASFISSLPSVGPNGETDLVVQHRTTQKGHEYLSIVSKKADQEFTIGQSKDMVSLYGKGWQPLYKGENATQNINDAAQQTSQVNNPLAGNPLPPNGGLQTQVQNPLNTGIQNQTQQQAPAASAAQENQAVNDVLSKYGL
jgi:hypothetical protein